MWDYLVRILKAEDVPRRPGTPDVPHAADAPHQVRSSTDVDFHGETEGTSSSHTISEALYCPVCHVRMNRERLRSSEAFICPECQGAFFTEAALKELLGAVLDLQGDEKAPLIYTPEGLQKRRSGPHHSDQA